MISDFLLIHYYAFYGNFFKYNEIYERFKILDQNPNFDPDGKYISVTCIDQFSFITLCIEHGCQYYYDFSKHIYESKIEYPNCVFQAISNRFAMSNDYNFELFDKFSPCRIWCPDYPSENMLELLYSKGFYEPVLFVKYLKNEINSNEHDDYFTKNLHKYVLNDNTCSSESFRANFNPQTQTKNDNSNKYSLEKNVGFNFLYRCTYGCSSFAIDPNEERKSFFTDDDFDYLNIIEEKGIDYPELCFSNSSFEIKFLNKTLKNKNFCLTEINNINVEEIYKNTYYATLVYNSTNKYTHECLTKFLQVGYVVNIESIIEYSIFDFNTEYMFKKEYYEYLINNLPSKFKYNICVAAIYSYPNFYFMHEFEPDFEIIKTAIKINNIEIIKDQFAKAIEKGFFYKHLDVYNKKWVLPPNKIYIREIFKHL